MRNTVHKVAYVYELIDPRDNAPFYVGSTNNLQKRYKEHIYTSNYTRKGKLTPVQHRINEIKTSGQSPVLGLLEQLEDCTTQQLRECEVYWMDYRHYLNGLALLNTMPIYHTTTIREAWLLWFVAQERLDEQQRYSALTASN